MVEKVQSSTNTYIQQRFAQLPQVEKGDAHIIKSGESLWNIAKKEVSKSKKKAKNSEINDYMLLMAKLNGLDTAEKMNKIKVNATIYLPGKEKKAGGTSPQARTTTTPQPARTTTPQARTTTKPQTARTNTQARTSTTPQPARKNTQARTTTKPQTAAPVKKNPPAHAMTSSEQSFADRMTTIYNDPNARVESSHLQLLEKDQLYTIYSKKTGKDGKVNPASPLMMVHLKANGKLESVVYDDNNDMKPISFDYTVRRNSNGSGKITSPDIAETGREPSVGTISAADLDKLEEWVNKNKKE